MVGNGGSRQTIDQARCKGPPIAEGPILERHAILGDISAPISHHFWVVQHPSSQKLFPWGLHSRHHLCFAGTRQKGRRHSHFQAMRISLQVLCQFSPLPRKHTIPGFPKVTHSAHLDLTNLRQVSTTCSICRYSAVAMTAMILLSLKFRRDVYMKSKRMQNPSGLISGSRLMTFKLHLSWSVKML